MPGARGGPDRLRFEWAEDEPAYPGRWRYLRGTGLPAALRSGAWNGTASGSNLPGAGAALESPHRRQGVRSLVPAVVWDDGLRPLPRPRRERVLRELRVDTRARERAARMDTASQRCEHVGPFDRGLQLDRPEPAPRFAPSTTEAAAPTSRNHAARSTAHRRTRSGESAPGGRNARCLTLRIFRNFAKQTGLPDGPFPVEARVYSNRRRYLLVLRFDYLDYRGIKHRASGGMTFGLSSRNLRTSSWSVGTLPSLAGLGPGTPLPL